MTKYIITRILLIFPTVFAIVAINFAVVQLAPGGPMETVAAQLRQREIAADSMPATPGLDAASRARIGEQFGFDKPPLARFAAMLRGYLTFDLGTSLFRGQPVMSLIWQRLPVSLSLGLWSTLIVYLVAIPLGIHKAVHDGSAFDLASSLVLFAGAAIPGFLLAILLVILFGAGGMAAVFPLGGLASPDAAGWPWPRRLADAAWHLVLPTIAMTIGGFAVLTLLVKNSFREEINKLYVLTAFAKGAGQTRVLYGHVFRNAMLLVAAGFPSTLVTILFTSTLLVEIIFSLNGLGLLGYQAILTRDDPVIFGTLYIYTLAALVARLLGDGLTALIDPRIDFSGQIDNQS